MTLQDIIAEIENITELWIELIIKKGFSKNRNEKAVTNYPKSYKRMMI